MKLNIACDGCKNNYSKISDLKVIKVSNGYIKLECPVCDKHIDNLSYPID
jgi:hypothetical protein